MESILDSLHGVRYFRSASKRQDSLYKDIKAMSEWIQKLRKGFLPSFWVANVMELFERLAYYGQQIVFMIYMRNRL